MSTGIPGFRPPRGVVEAPASCEPIIARSILSRETNMTKNVLLIGIVSHTNGYKPISRPELRDQARFDEINAVFHRVWTLAGPHCADWDPSTHVVGKMNRGGAKSLVTMLGGEKLDYICVDHVRMYNNYYVEILIGDNNCAVDAYGQEIVGFMNHLMEHACLNDGCQLQFARHERGRGWAQAFTT